MVLAAWPKLSSAEMKQRMTAGLIAAELAGRLEVMEKGQGVGNAD